MSEDFKGDKLTMVEVMAWWCHLISHCINQCWPYVAMWLNNLGHWIIRWSNICRSVKVWTFQSWLIMKYHEYMNTHVWQVLAFAAFMFSNWAHVIFFNFQTFLHYFHETCIDLSISISPFSDNFWLQSSLPINPCCQHQINPVNSNAMSLNTLFILWWGTHDFLESIKKSNQFN